MAKFEIKFKGGLKEWDEIKLAFSGNLKKMGKQAMKKATLRGLQRIDDDIRNNKFERLAATTLLQKRALKYSSIPLIRTGRLLRGLTTNVPEPFEGLVGINLKGGRGKINIAELLHEGATITMTPEMKRAAAAALQQSAKKLGVPKLRLGLGGNSVIRIPPRPFIKKTFESEEFVREVEQIFIQTAKEFLEK